MSKMTAVFLFVLATALMLHSCSDCLGSDNSVPDPGPGEYTLVVNNGISRDLPVYVDGKQVATVCEETGNVKVGNFVSSICSKFQVFDEVNQCMAYLTPCGGTLCHETCSTDCFNTTALKDRTATLGIQWEYGN
jgi:hypothetical protein